MEYLTAERAKRKRADTAKPKANPWERKGENTQGNSRLEVMLNRRMPNGTYGGVRGRFNPPYSI